MLIFMLNERKSEKAVGATGGAYSAPPDPLAVTGGGTPPPVPTPACEYLLYPPFQKSGSAADENLVFVSARRFCGTGSAYALKYNSAHAQPR